MPDAEQGKALPRVGLLSQDEIRIAGVTAALEGPDGAEVVLMSHPGMLESLRLDLVLIDSTSAGYLLEIITLFQHMRPHVRLVVLGGTPEMDFVEQAILAGARGVLSHDASENELRMAVQVVREGSVWAPRKVLSRLLDRAGSKAAPEKVHLTPREVEVLRLLVRGLSNREIADELKVELATVKAHLGRMMRKAGVSNRTALGTVAVSQCWL